VGAWELAEESGSAATGRQSQGNNDWLNIRTGSGFGSSSGIWASPITAANETADFLEGKSVPGAGTASKGIQSILSTAGQPASATIAAIGSSGWGTDASNITQIYNKNTASGGVLASIAGTVTSAAGDIGSAAGDVGSTAGQAAGDVGSTVSAGADAVSEVSSIWSALTNPSNWLRGLEILGAVLVVYFALKSLTGTDPTAVVEKTAAVAAAV
jgi:hypothetical protein